MSAPGPELTVVHLLRHGEVHNPGGVLYGRSDGFGLSELGGQMARRAAASLEGHDVVHVRASPLQRTRETAAPLAEALGLEVVLDPRVVESHNVFEGERLGGGIGGLLRNPRRWRHFWNPLRPSWGEPYVEIAARMKAAVDDAREVARGHEAVVVSHQLPIWTTRMLAERRRFAHDPRTRHCTLCSLTSLHFVGDALTRVTYSEPAADLVPLKDRGATFSSGGAS